MSADVYSTFDAEVDWSGFYPVNTKLADLTMEQIGFSKAGEVLARIGAKALLPKWARRELATLNGTHPFLAPAQFVYDAMSMAGESGLGCTAYADPVKRRFMRTLDWCFPRKLGRDLRVAHFGDVKMPVVPGTIGAHTMFSPRMCLALNQVTMTDTDMQGLAGRLWAARGRLPTMLWLRQAGFRLDWLLKETSMGPAEAVRHVFCQSAGEPMAPCIVTGLVVSSRDACVAFRYEFYPDQAPSLRWESEVPMASTNHFLTLENRTGGHGGSKERLKAVYKHGPKAFDREPVRDVEVLSGFWDKKLA